MQKEQQQFISQEIMAEEKFLQDHNICIPSNTRDLPTINLSVDIFGTQTRESFQEMPHGDALQVKSVVGEVACSEDESYKIQTKRSLKTVVAGISSPASAPSTPINQNVRKRRNSATPLKQNPSKKCNCSTDKPDQKPKLKKCRPEKLNDEDNTKCTPTIQVSELDLKIRTPAVSSTHKARSKRTYIRKNCSKLVADSLTNIRREAANKSCKRALKFDLDIRTGDGRNQFENKDNQAVTVDLVKEVEKQCFLPVHHETSHSLINSRESGPKFQKMCRKRKTRRLVHIFGSSCRTVKTAEVGKKSDKGIIPIKKLGKSGNGKNLNTKLDCATVQSQAALESLDMYSAIKMKRRRLAGSTQRPLINMTSFPKEAPMHLHKNAGSSVELNKKHKFRAKVDLDEESDRVYNLLMSTGGNFFDQKAEADSEKKEHWDRERNLTRNRVESFISTIGMIQGDRSFSPWKGSVVDSVVGAFLTQNVCDHFSSSAFMSLAARFPNHKLNGKSKNSEPENSGLWPNRDKTAPTEKRGLKFNSQLPSYIEIEYKDEELKEPSTACDNIRKKQSTGRARDDKTMDVVDWEAVRQANVDEVAEIIKDRGMNNVIAGKIKGFLNKIVEEHGSPDLEWLRDVPPEEAKNYLLNIFGIGLKSVECIRLLTLHHVAFPVDTNVRRVAVRLGWVPLKPLPEGLQMHLLEMYPVVNSIQKYLYPRLCTLDQEKLYLLHYHLITFGKVFCTKRKPNCNACPMRGECKYFASAFASHRLDLPSPERKDIVTTQNLVVKTTPLVLRIDPEYQHKYSELGSKHLKQKCEPIIEYPASPGPCEPDDIEDLFKVSDDRIGFGNYDDDDDIPFIRIDSEACMNNITEYTKRNNIPFEGDKSEILALLNSSNPLPMPPLKHVGRLRTVHQVYELPDDHPILDDVEKRDPDDPSPYLFAVWNEGKRRSSVSQTSSTGKQVRYDIVCNCSEPDCRSLVCGTLLIPVRSANHGTFPLNGTYFQVNEVFADDESSERPIVVPRDWLWGLTRRNLYCGTSPATTFKGFTLYHIQHAFCKGFFCNRGFNREKRYTTTLGHRFHINTMQPKEKAACHKQ